jgi:hypothetical protein
MRKGNLTNWIAVLCLAAAGMPAAAQQSPSVLTRVRSLLGQTPAPKPAAAPAPTPAPRPAPPTPAPAAPASAASPAPVQNTKPMAAATAPINRPLAPAMKPVSAPATPNAPAASTESRGPFKPGGNPPIKTVAGVKGVPANGLKAGEANSKLISAAPNPKAADVKVEEPRDIPKADALPAIVPVKENVSRRDPFSPLLAKEAAGNGTPLNLPPGKPGLMIGNLHIDGIVNGPNGMIAIVSNPQQRVYFLREGDHLYDGQVEHITMDGIAFHQTGKDPFGNAVEREVAKRLNPMSPGEQQ